jgi:hypothetical protein
MNFTGITVLQCLYVCVYEALRVVVVRVAALNSRTKTEFS